MAGDSSLCRDPTKSPFAHYLTTNYVPSAEEGPRISAIISEQECAIARLDVEIDQLLREREAFRGSVKAHKSLLAPARRMPFELWSQIFVDSLPPGEFFPIDHRQPPLLLGQVCSCWRDIAASTPRLWNTLSFRKFGQKLTKSHLSAIFASWIAHSGNLPLSIQLVGLKSTSHEHVVDLLIPFTSRIRNLHTAVSHSLLTRMLERDISQLTAITLIAPAEQTPLVISKTAVNLRSLTLLYLVNIDLFVFPWAQLTELTVKDFVSYNECFSIFHRCRQLCRLSLRYIRGSHDGRTRARVLLPQLASILLSTNADPDPLLDNLTLPRLNEVALDIADRPHWPHEKLVALLERSSSPLHTLVIPNYGVNGPALLRLVCRIPTLKKLLYSGVAAELPRDVARVLELRSTSETIGPRGHR